MQQPSAANPEPARRIIVLSLLAAMLSTIVAVAGPLVMGGNLDGAASGSVSLSKLGWIFAQSYCLTWPGIAIGLLLANRAARMSVLCGAGLIFAVPVLMLVDAITFSWIGERFLSSTSWRVVTELRSGLLGHISIAMVIGGIGMILLTTFVSAAAWWLAGRIATRWQRSENAISPTTAWGLTAALALLIASPALRHFDETKLEMAAESCRHPLCVIGCFAYQSPGRMQPIQERDSVSPFEQAVSIRDHQQRQLSIRSIDDSSQPLPDVVIVVVESFRHELVQPDVMPQLWRYASRGLHCRSHFSGGNATNHGMFSLLNGLEAIWYERPVRYSPLLVRLFRKAGYELGFFAGHDDWRKFYMDGYLSDEHFDTFEISPPDGLASDRRATRLAASFLDRQSTADEPRPPRLALLYLYATHATYRSYAEDRLFAPAADDRFMIPYSSSSREQVWNRYKNSARTVDRFLEAVMREDRIVLVTGDHGEAFLEDGTIGHGIRISAVQNMTPAVLFVPNRAPRVIEVPTSHADLLPTLLSAVGIKSTDELAFDGIDLHVASDQLLSKRLLLTRNYLHEDVGLIGPWTREPEGPFAYRANVSLRNEPAVSPLNAIDQSGYEDSSADETKMNDAVQTWIDSRLRAYLP